MSKPTNQPSRDVRRPKLRTKELCIAAIEGTGPAKGKIVAFEVRYGADQATVEPFPVGKEKKSAVKLAFQRAEGFATKLLPAAVTGTREVKRATV